MEIPYGYCQCGCGEKTVPSYRSKGKLLNRYIRHHNDHRRGEENNNWKGGKAKDGSGYMRIYMPNHTRACNSYVFEHVLIAEKVLGKPLPHGAVVHHVNGIKDDNRNNNLVICESIGYHKILHRRTKALAECGHASWRQCVFCGEYDDPANMAVQPGKAYHRACRNEFMKEKRRKKKEVQS